MKHLHLATACFALALSGLADDDLQRIGVTGLRAVVPGLTGEGVILAQPEAGSPAWEVNPASTGLSSERFRWGSGRGISTVFPNTLGSESWHANEGGNRLYGHGMGVAPGLALIANYEAGYFLGSLVPRQSYISAPIINQSFVAAAQSATIDQDIDNYGRFAQHVPALGGGE